MVTVNVMVVAKDSATVVATAGEVVANVYHEIVEVRVVKGMIMDYLKYESGGGGGGWEWCWRCQNLVSFSKYVDVIGM